MEHTAWNTAILGIGTALPRYQLDQTETSIRLADALRDNPDSARWAKRIFKQCGVETRYTCEPDLLNMASDCSYFAGNSSRKAPTTAERMITYQRESVPLGLEAARAALSKAYTVSSDITHLITVSCTGQFLPGLDTILIRELQLRDDVNRITLNFLGCAAGLKAVCLAKQFVSANAAAKVLVVCVELCTIHIQSSSKREDLFAASFFGDGASSCVVGKTEPHHRGFFELSSSRSVLLQNCADKMIWEVGNHGFELFLSPEIPQLIGSTVPAEIARLLGGGSNPAIWAIHPGGRGIIDAIQTMYGLSDHQTQASRDVLRQYGNLSSATILFVLDQIARAHIETDSGYTDGIALAFGPGLTVEMIKIAYWPEVMADAPLAAEA